MNTILFDECTDSRHLTRLCTREGKVPTVHFPIQLRGKKVLDPEVIMWCSTLDLILLTRDASMLEDHSESIPNEHKGIVAVCNAGPLPLDPITIGQVLSEFKQRLPQWHQLTLDNVWLELWNESSDADVCVYRIRDGAIEWHENFSYSDPNWQANFMAALDKAKV